MRKKEDDSDKPYSILNKPLKGFGGKKLKIKEVKGN